MWTSVDVAFPTVVRGSKGIQDAQNCTVANDYYESRNPEDK
jgi:hypothetical protein